MKREVLRPMLRPGWLFGLLLGGWLTVTVGGTSAFLALTDSRVDLFVSVPRLTFPPVEPPTVEAKTGWYDSLSSENIDVLTIGNTSFGNNTYDAIAFHASATGYNSTAIFADGKVSIQGQLLLGDRDVMADLTNLAERVRLLESFVKERP